MLERACGDRPFYTVWWKDAIRLERATLPSVKTSLEGGRPSPTCLSFSSAGSQGSPPSNGERVTSLYEGAYRKTAYRSIMQLRVSLTCVILLCSGRESTHNRKK